MQAEQKKNLEHNPRRGADEMEAEANVGHYLALAGGSLSQFRLKGLRLDECNRI